MNILWVVNTIFPDAAKHLGLPSPASGGWMYGMAADLASQEELNLAVATVYDGKDLKSFNIARITYYLVPRNVRKQRSGWLSVVSEFNPVMSHIHGTEYGHGMELMRTCPDLKCIVSIQGLVSVCYRYFMAGLSFWDVLYNVTLRDVIRWNTLFHSRHDFYIGGKVERDYIRRAYAIVGRTEWDYAHVKAINPLALYHFCNESLRSQFYEDVIWSYEGCRKYNIFLSQAGYPLKGLHQVLKAVALLKEKYPDICISIAGQDITSASSFWQRIKMTGYGQYIRGLIQKLDLVSNVKFLGHLDASAMRLAYVSANVFVCPSSIENSPNSLGEAQILGVPCIASYVGGIPSMIKADGGCLLYRFEEYEMLAVLIERVFDSDVLMNALSVSGKKEADVRHDRNKNLEKLLEIYGR